MSKDMELTPVKWRTASGRWTVTASNRGYLLFDNSGSEMQIARTYPTIDAALDAAAEIETKEAKNKLLAAE